MKRLLFLVTVMSVLGMVAPALARKGDYPSPGLVQDAIANLQSKDLLGSVRSQYEKRNDPAGLGDVLIAASTLANEIWASRERIAVLERDRPPNPPSNAEVSQLKADVKRLDSLLADVYKEFAAAAAKEAEATHNKLYAELNPKIDGLQATEKSNAAAFGNINGYLEEVRRTFAVDSVAKPHVVSSPLPRVVAGVGVVAVSALLFALTHAQ